MTTKYICPRCGNIFKTDIDPQFIKTPPMCAGIAPGHPSHIKPAQMELQND